MARKQAAPARRKRRTKPTKIAALVVSAIQDLRETKGTTSKQIAGYISYTLSLPEERVKRRVKAALKRGVEHGILRRYRGHYFLLAGDELDRANRIAMRFARLPTPAPLLPRSKSNFARKTKDRKKRREVDSETRKVKKSRSSSSSPSVAAVPSLTDKLAGDVASAATK